jgi:hypothetical protein
MNEKKLSISKYYIYVVIGAILVFMISLSLAPFAPLDEPKVYAYDGEYYNLGIPVGFSFSAFISLIIFILSAIILWGNKNLIYNIIIDSSALSFIILNYINYFFIWDVWKPSITFLPFFVLIKYNGATAMQLDLGQIVLIIFLYRFYKFYKKSSSSRPLSGSDLQ